MSKQNLSAVKNGIVCFTFDDRNFEGWINALPLFEKYNAHATFFVCGEIDQKAKEAIAVLREKGHTVGLHTLNHADAPQYFEQNGAEAYFENEIKPQLNGYQFNCFAYPNNRRNEETDEYLSKYFQRFRAGTRGACEQEIFVPVCKLSENKVMRGFGIGEYYSTTVAELIERLEYAQKTNTCLTFFSHNISSNPDAVSMTDELLEICLKKASELGLLMLGFDQI